MSLRRGFQVVVGAIRRRVLQQGQGHVHAREKPEGLPCYTGEQPLITQRRGAVVLHQNSSANFARSAARIWGQGLQTRIRLPQANGSRSAPPPPILPLLLGFAGVGFARNGAEISREDLKQTNGSIDLDAAIKTIQTIFGFQERDDNELGEDVALPTNLEGYCISETILAKGTEGVVYGARTRDLIPAQEMDSGLQNGVISSHQEEQVEEFNHDDSRLEICDERECSLALKMMFNYNIGSTSEDIHSEFKAEQLPLLLESGKFGKTCSVESGKGLCYRHPNIVRIHDAFVDRVRVPNLEQALLHFDMALPRRLHPLGEGADETLFIVMKRYKTSLRKYLKDNAPLPDRVAMLTVVQILEAVTYLGRCGIVHRDIKSDNILVDCDEDNGMPHVVLSDFGCSMSLRGRNMSESLLDADRRNPGNCSLRAPEVKNAYTQNCIKYGDYFRADVWAVGAIAYEICGQENPFYSIGGLQSDTYQEQSLPPLQTEAVGLRLVVQLLLQRDPDKRPCASVAADILHLFLWQPRSTNSLAKRYGRPSSPERELTSWLFKVSLGYLFADQFSTTTFDQVEQGILGVFLRRLSAGSLVQASHHAMRAVSYVTATFTEMSCTAPIFLECDHGNAHTWHQSESNLALSCQS